MKIDTKEMGRIGGKTTAKLYNKEHFRKLQRLSVKSRLKGRVRK
jgi:hypothetical protein